MRMNKQKTLACTLSMLAVALLLLVPFACLPAPTHIALNNDTGTGAAQYSYENLFKSGTVFSDRTLSYPFESTITVRDMAIGDLNSDGISDVAVATDTRIIIFYGTGNGALSEPNTLSFTMSDARKIAIGDLDNDNKADIAITYINPSDGKGRLGLFFQKDSFMPQSSLQINTYSDPWQVVIGDFSNSGSNGVAVICAGDPITRKPPVLMILMQDYAIPDDMRAIEFPAGSYPGLDSAKLLAAGHVNADGRLDLVVGDAYGDTIVALTQPDEFSNFWSPVTLDIGGSIADLRFMDYSGSGVARDLVTINYGADSNQIEIRDNVGGIPASPTRTFSFGGASLLAVGSVTGASSADLLVISGAESRARLYPDQGAGLDAGAFFQFPINGGPIKAIILPNGIYLLSAGSAGVASTVEFYRYADSRIANADWSKFVDEGRPTSVCAGDVSFGIIAAIYDGQRKVYITTPTGESRVINTASVPTDLYIGDLDGDSVGDLAISFQSSDRIIIYKGSNGFMSNSSPFTIDLPPELSQPFSMTGGRIDVLGTDVLIVGCHNGVDVIYNPMSESPTHETIGAGSSDDMINVGFGSLDPSGVGSSIVALNSNDGRSEIYYLKESPSIGDCYGNTYNAALISPGLTPYSIAVGDFDGNGRDDVAAATSSKQLKIFANMGAGFTISTQPTFSLLLPGDAELIRSEDLNDDGKDDLAIKYEAIPEIGIWLSKGSSTFSNPFDVTSGGIASGVSLADINGDGRADIVASSSTAKALSYWLQRNLVPDAKVWYSAGTLNIGGTVRFDASNSTDSWSDKEFLTYLWNFGDGNSSNQKEAEHQYTSDGVFACSLTVTDRDGLTDKVDFQITVNKPMEARIWASKYSPLKGEKIYLQDVSYVPNGVSSRQWDLGDGQKSSDPDVEISYALPGYYNITLTITDTIGDTSTDTVMISVVQSSNPIEGLIANGGGTSFFMDEQIFFEVKIKGSGAPIVGFTWDMDYNADQGFTPTGGITINQTVWSYNTIGEHTICVRNYNVNPYLEEFLTIYIMNHRPVAVISASNETWGNFTFDAIGSWDTPTDNDTLLFRWNFGEINGWTEWSSESRITKNYTTNGVYTVILEVKDQHGYVNSTVYYAIVDNKPPTIDLDSDALVSQGYRGEDLVIKVKVTDISDDVKLVLLVYTTNNETKTLVMSRVGGTNTYVATIPAMDVVGSLSYYIRAMDGDGNWETSAAMGVTLVDRPDALWMYLVAIIGAAAGAFLLLYYRSRMVVDDVFIIYQDGNLMAHQTRRLKPGMDDQILGSMLVAIQDFVKDSFKDESSTRLNRMDFGEKKVLVEKGEHIYLAVVLHGKREGRVPQRMKDTISKAERDYLEALQEWDGDLEKVRGIKDETDPLLKPGLKDLVSSIPFLGKEDMAELVEMTMCSYCENAYPATEPKCPKCGTVPDSKTSPGGTDEAGGQAA